MKNNVKQHGRQSNITSLRNVESLEGRLFLSAAVTPVVHDLMDVSTLPGREGIKMQRAGSTLFDGGATAITSSKNGRKDLSASATAYAKFTLEFDAIAQKLSAAPMEFTAAARSNPLTFALPKPDGTYERFYVVEAQIMAKGLADQFPDMKTYRGIGIDDPNATLAMDHTHLGFHAQVISPNGAYYIDPQFVADKNGAYMSYYRSNARMLPDNEQYLEPELPDDHDHKQAPRGGKETQALPFGTQLKTYRAAVAANGEYTGFWGGTVADGQAAVVVAINRVSGVYENELAIRLQLVANNTNIIYTNPATDPYSNGTNAINENQVNLDNNAVMGTFNYDIGHVFTTGSGGIAGLGVVGMGGNKARGTTGLPNPVGDPFLIDFVAHEIGHQFGASHTFNTSADPARSPTHAYEPGSGTSIMGYAGIVGTPSENVMNHSVPFFLHDSIDFIRSFVTNTIPGTGTTTNTGNNPPTVNAGLDYVIPAHTTFALTPSSSSDPDGNPLTFDWQERDLGPAVLLTTPDNGSSPLFRAFAPLTNPTRTFTRLASLVVGQVPVAEKLPTVNRAAMNFRVIARDNRPGGGGVASDDMFLQVVNTGSAFTLTSPNTAVNWAGGTTQAVNWNVAGTTANGINAANVKITLSTDGGLTYPTTILASTPNDGTENIIVPQVSSTTARIRVEGVNNVFFDISNVDFTITGTSAAPQMPQLIGGDSGFSSTDGITNQNNQAGKKLTFRIPNSQNGATITVKADGLLTLASGVGNGGNLDLETSGSLPLSNGAHVITATATAPGLGESPASPPLNITIDTVAPQVLAGQTVFGFTPGQSLTFKTNETLPQLLATEVTINNLTTVTTVPNTGFTASYNAGTNTGTFNFPSLADGSYRAVFTGQDTAGNVLSASNNSFNFIYAGGASAHTFNVAKVGANTEVTKDGSTVFSAVSTTLSQIALDGSGAQDSVVINNVNGSPIPFGANGFRYVGGAGGDNFTVTNPGTFTFNADPSIDTTGMLLTSSAGATVNLSGAGTSTLGSVQAAGGDIVLTNGGSRLLVTDAIGYTGTSKLDLNDNDLLVHGGTATAIGAMIANAYNFGSWDQGGVFSTAAKNNASLNTTLGVLSGDDFNNNNGSPFNGQSITSGDALVKYTYFGDVDFNGSVDVSDYNLIDFGFGSGLTGWANGDADYSGGVDASDYNVIDFAFSTQGGTL